LQWILQIGMVVEPMGLPSEVDGAMTLAIHLPVVEQSLFNMYSKSRRYARRLEGLSRVVIAPRDVTHTIHSPITPAKEGSRSMSVQRFSAHSPVAEIQSAIDADGCAVISGLVPDHVVSKVRADLELIEQNADFGEGLFVGARTKRLGAI